MNYKQTNQGTVILPSHPNLPDDITTEYLASTDDINIGKSRICDSASFIPSTSAKQYLLYLQGYGHEYATPDFYSKKVTVSSYRIICSLSGQGKLSYQGKNYELFPGTAFFINCALPHIYRNVSDEIWENIFLSFDGAAVPLYYERFIMQGSPCFTPSETFMSLLHDIINITSTPASLRELRASTLLARLLTQLLFSDDDLSTTNSFVPNWVQMLAAYIDDHLAENLTLDILARRCGFNKFYMAREFKKYIGFSPNEYLIRQRLSYAKNLLVHTDMAIADIADKSGIPNVNYFSCLFKKAEGIPPSIYRKNWSML